MESKTNSRSSNFLFTHADIITIQEIKLTPKANTSKVHNFTTVRADRLHKAGCGLITLIRDNITLTTTDIPSTINTHHNMTLLNNDYTGSNDLSLHEVELSGNYRCQQIEINSYPDSPLSISTGFLPRLSSMRLN